MNINTIIIKLLILLFPITVYALPCPADKPIQDTHGNCFPCDTETVLMQDEYTSEIPSYIGDCQEICPNRLSYSDGWLDPVQYCVLDTFENRLMSHLIPNLMLIVLPPFWINLVVLIFLLRKLFLCSIKKQFSGKSACIILCCVVLGLFINMIFTISVTLFPMGTLCYLFLWPIIMGAYHISRGMKRKAVFK